jgi:hypothetical protein
MMALSDCIDCYPEPAPVDLRCSNIPAWRRFVLFVAPLSLAICAGCDLTGQYDVRFQETLKKAAARAVFDQYLYPTTIEVTDASRKNLGVKLRIPKFFDTNTKALPATDARAKPPFLNLPGLSYAMERQLDDETAKFLPVYAYLAAVPKSEQKPDVLANTIAQQAAAAFPGAKWADASLPTPSGGALNLKRLHLEGKQEFADLTKNPPAPASVDGVFDLYLIDAGDTSVLIGWRAPKAQAQKYQFTEATEAAMGTTEAPQAADGPPSTPAPAAKT